MAPQQSTMTPEEMAVVAKQVNYTVEWFREDLPLENKEGDTLDRILEGWYNEDLKVPSAMDNFVKPSGAQQARFPDPQPPRESVLVFADSGGCAKRIMAAAPEGRVGTKKIVERQAWESMTTDEINSLISSQPDGWDMIVFAASLEPPPSSHVQTVIDHQSIVTHLYLDVIKAAQASGKAKRIGIVSAGVFSTDPADHEKHGLGMISSSVIFGMTNTARLEFEEVFLHFIDAEPALAETPESDRYQLFPRLATELFRLQTFGHDTVRILNKGRYVLRQVDTKEYRAANCDFTFAKEGIIAISGGNGALGLVMGEWLLKQCRRQGIGKGMAIQFLSRSMKIGADNMPRWNAIQEQAAEMGVEVVQAKGDFSSQEAVDKYMSAIGPNLVGFIHSAGVLADTMVSNLTWEKCETVFDPKHRAALYIHNSLDRFQMPNLAFFWMFSSISVWGNMGQTNYSGSNAFLDALCRHRRARGKPATALQWGGWGEVGMAAHMNESMKARFANGPMPYVTNAEGLAGLEQALQTGLPLVTVFKFNPGVMISMTTPASNPKECYLRNFTWEIFLPPMVDSLERHHMLSAYRSAFGQYSKIPGVERLHYDRFTRPRVQRHQEEWGDSFRSWAAVKA